MNNLVVGSHYWVDYECSGEWERTIARYDGPNDWSIIACDEILNDKKIRPIYEIAPHGDADAVKRIALDQYMLLKMQYQGNGEKWSELFEEARGAMFESWRRLIAAVGNPNLASQLVLDDPRHPRHHKITRE